MAMMNSSYFRTAECIVGHRDFWPGEMLGLLFNGDVTLPVISRVAAFMFGNGVNEGLCINTWRECSSYYINADVVQKVHDLYYVWSHDEGSRGYVMYWNVNNVTMMYLDGKCYTTKAETVIVVLLTEEALVDHHSAEKDLLQMDQQVKVTLLVKNESQTREAIQEELVVASSLNKDT